jgi:hypothetical protein
MSHILFYNDIKEMTIGDFILKLEKNCKIVIGDIKLTDLLPDNKSLIGVYIFYDDKDIPKYVGSTSSRPLFERMAGHFDLRPEGYMNYFLCALAIFPNKKGFFLNFLSYFSIVHYHHCILA